MLMPLPRVSDLGEFRDRYLLRERAVVVTGALAAMPASRWTPAYLTEVLGEQRPTVRLADGRLAYMRMRDFFRYFEAPTAGSSSKGSVYLKEFYIAPSFGDEARAKVAQDIRYPLVEAAEWPEWSRGHTGWNSLYIGPAATGSSLHVDVFSTSTWLAQIAGLKAWRVCEPGAVTEEVAFKTDPFSGHPLPCDFYETVLGPGEVIYLPPNWWHAVENKTASISVSGNVCTVEHARACLAAVQSMEESSSRDVWLKTWTAVLEGRAPAPQ